VATISGSTNACVNPSFETNVTGWTGTNGTLAQDTTDGWVGSACAKLTVTSVATEPRIDMTGATRPNVTGNDNVTVHARIKAPAGRTVYLRLDYRDSGNVSVGTTDGPNVVATGDWQKLVVSGEVIPSSVKLQPSIRLKTSGAVVGDVVKYDGIDVRVNDNYDTYIDGDQGSLYAWTGTAHASSSQRVSTTSKESTGTGGVIQMKSFLYRSNRAGDRLENLSGDIIEGEVTFDQESEIKMSFKGKIRDITELTAYEDYIIPVLRLTYADGTQVEEQIGHFIIVPAPRRYTYTSTEGDIDGRGLEWLLTLDEFDKAFTVNAGVDYVTAVRGLLSDLGFTNIHIPLSGKTLPKKRSWKTGTKKIEVINALLDSCNYTPIYTGRDGAFRARPLPNTHTIQPSVTYDAAGLGSELVGTITETPDMTNFANKVIVLAEDAQRNQIRAVAINKNPASPTSTVRLKFTKSITHTSKNLNNSADAQALAKRMLERANRHLVKLEIETLPDPTRNPYEVYTIRARQEGGDYVAFGNYACTGWTIGFTPEQGSMKHKVERLEIYE
jgi:hypothetical protein